MLKITCYFRYESCRSLTFPTRHYGSCSRFSRKGDAFALYFGRIKHFQVVSTIKPCSDTTSDDDVVEVLRSLLKKSEIV